MNNWKQRLRPLLERRQMQEIALLAAGKRRVLGALLSLLFDTDPLIVWRAIEATGVAADRIADDSPETVRNHLRRLHWLISEESGGICWHAPEAIAEIVVRRPGMFPEYASIVVSLLTAMEEEDLVRFRPGILWAIGRLAAVAPKAAEGVLPAIVACLDDANPQVRGTAAWCLGELGCSEPVKSRPHLLSDEGPSMLYLDGTLFRATVGERVRSLLRLPGRS